MSIVMVFFLLLLLKLKKIVIKNYFDWLILLYIIYNTISCITFIYSDLPISVFVMEYSNSILPMICFYFIGKMNLENLNFYDITLYSIFACFLIGFYYQFNLPENYREFMAKLDNTEGTGPEFFILYFRSLLGITATGSLSAICVLLSLDKIYRSNGRFGKIIFLISFIVLLLTFRRSAFYVTFFAILWVNYLAIFKFKLTKKRLIIFEVASLIFLGLLLNYMDPEFINSVIERFGSFNDAIDERNQSWFDGISKTKNLIIGDGLGRYGHKAALFTDNIIPDGNYFRIFSELGIIGLFLFLSIIVSSLFKSYKKLNKYYIEFAIILMICLQGVGSDIFSFQLIAPIFWFTIGRCSMILVTIR